MSFCESYLNTLFEFFYRDYFIDTRLVRVVSGEKKLQKNKIKFIRSNYGKIKEDIAKKLLPIYNTRAENKITKGAFKKSLELKSISVLKSGYMQLTFFTNLFNGHQVTAELDSLGRFKRAYVGG
jgi:hypothetical protein